MTEVWTLPGYDVQELLGFGTTGEVWRARELATGDDVALKRLRAGLSNASLGREAEVLRTLDTPYVVRLRAIVEDGIDAILVLDLAAGGSLAGLLTRRRSLDPGEVVTIAAPLAQALAAAHAHGLVHGAVTPANVLFTQDGMPLLADLGLARASGEPINGKAEYADPAAAGRLAASSDVWALAAICDRLIGGRVPPAPRALVEAIASALQPDPAQRPDAAGFARMLLGSCPAAPVRLVSGDPRAASREPRLPPTAATAATAAPSRRWPAAASAAVLALGAAAGVGWWSGRAGSAEQASVVAAASPAAAAGAPDWRVVLDQLDAARAAAFASADPTRLLAVYAPTSPLLAADRTALERLRAAGRRARGVRHAAQVVSASSYDETSVVLRVVDVLAAYDVVDGDGHLLERTVARGAATFVVTLVRADAGWRLLGLRPA